MAQAEARGEDLKKGYMFWLPLTAVLREGIETIIFLAGTSSGYPVRSRLDPSATVGNASQLADWKRDHDGARHRSLGVCQAQSVSDGVCPCSFFKFLATRHDWSWMS